jgi:flagellar hook-length control protein FliK
MADFPMELNSYLGTTGLTPIAVPSANIAIERHFSEHLDEIESRASESSVGVSPNPSFDSAATAQESNSLDSANKAQFDSTDAVNEKAHKDAQEISNEVADVRADTDTVNGPYANVAGMSGQASSADTNPNSEPVRGKATGRAQLRAKPGSEHQKQKLEGAGVELGTEKQDFDQTPADSDSDAREIRLSSQVRARKTPEKLGTRANVKAVVPGRESRKNAAEKVANDSGNGDVSMAAPEGLPVDDDAAPAVRQTRRNHSKHASNIHATTAVEEVSAAAESVSPETALIAQVRATDPSPSESQNKEQTLQRASDPLPENASGQNDRTITAPTLLSSHHDESSRTLSQRDGLSDVERLRLLQRVARAFHSIGDEGGELQLRLRPPELGTLRLEIAVRDGVMTARLETETAAARNVLLDNLPQLRDRLAEQNVKVERFDVNVRDDGQQRNDQAYEGQSDLQRSPRRAARTIEQLARSVSAVPAIGPRIGRGEGSDQLNVVI